MSIKNLHIKHWVKNNRYLCIHACSTTKQKIAKTKKDITCKNCLKILKVGEQV